MTAPTKNITDITAADLTATGLSACESDSLLATLRQAISVSTAPGESRPSPPALWREIVDRRALRPDHPHALHQLVYYSVYGDWDAAVEGPPIYWFPSPYEARNTNLGRLIEAHGPRLLGSLYKDPISSYRVFHEFSVHNPEIYWSIFLKEISVSFRTAPKCILDTSDKSKRGGTWLPGSVLNIAECCLLPTSHPRKMDNNLAVVWRDEGSDDCPVNWMTLKELREQVMLVANALETLFSRGDAIAIDMPMTVNAVIIYLAIILAGCVVVSIADSFAAKEIATRLRVSKAKGIFTQDFIIRGGRTFPLYSRVVEAAPDVAIVLQASGKDLKLSLRSQDVSWNDFLAGVAHLSRPHYYSPIYQPIDSLTNILFSSGTTGEPKAVPWTQLTPVRSAADAWAHLSVQAGDVFCWPTNLGWVMGPTIVYTSFLCGAALALYHGSPLGRGFGCWGDSVGHSSQPSKNLEKYTMHGQAGLDQVEPDDQPCEGEMALSPIHMGASDRLLNADHEEIYFKGMPDYNGMRLRRHGDILKRTVGGYYHVLGRADDTMNLGGIKTSSVEIEHVCNRADESILETAAVSIAPVQGGPEQLVLFVVLKQGYNLESEKLRTLLSKAIQRNLNPLFKVSFVKILPEFPRTASNKVLRRVLRDQIKQEAAPRSQCRAPAIRVNCFQQGKQGGAQLQAHRALKKAKLLSLITQSLRIIIVLFVAVEANSDHGSAKPYTEAPSAPYRST
ncbi:putative CoA ligase CCL12 [Drosera capensis]